MAEEFNAGNADVNNIETKVMNDSGSLNDYLNNLNGTFSTFSTEGSSEQVYGAKPEKPSIESLKVDEDGITEYVTPDMLIGDIITWYPEASLVLMKCGMHCISCGVSQFETLDQACAVHGLYTDDVAKVVNDYLTQTLGGKAEQLAKEAENKDN